MFMTLTSNFREFLAFLLNNPEFCSRSSRERPSNNIYRKKTNACKVQTLCVLIFQVRTSTIPIQIDRQKKAKKEKQNLWWDESETSRKDWIYKDPSAQVNYVFEEECAALHHHHHHHHQQAP